MPQGSALSSAQWHATLPPAVFAAPAGATDMLRLRRWTDTAPEMLQPALDDNVLVMHLGGAKRVRRWRDGRMGVHDVGLGSITILPAGRGARWVTEGPVDFAHLTLTPALLDRVLVEEFDRGPDRGELRDDIGVRDPCLERLFSRLLSGGEGTAPGRLYTESLLVVMIAELLAGHSAGAARRPAGPAGPVKGGMAAWRLKRVHDYMMGHLDQDVGLAELTGLSGLSRAQFYRAFRQSTGFSPARYLAHLRMDRARASIDAGQKDLDLVARAVGVASRSRFNLLFRARFGVSPRLYRLARA